MEKILKSGLYVVATPIGNLGDLSPRAKQVLEGVDFVAAEDTRSAAKLLSLMGIKAKLVSYHDHNEKLMASKLAEQIVEGATIALVSDAGTPTISDPGYRLVKACRDIGVEVFSVAGPCALIAALSISGLPTDRFLFEGFLPPKGEKRKTRIKNALTCGCTVIFYESIYKIERLLTEFHEIQPEMNIVIVREITKLYEEYLSGTPEKLLGIIKSRGSLKGELVVIINPT